MRGLRISLHMCSVPDYPVRRAVTRKLLGGTECSKDNLEVRDVFQPRGRPVWEIGASATGDSVAAASTSIANSPISII